MRYSISDRHLFTGKKAISRAGRVGQTSTPEPVMPPLSSPGASLTSSAAGAPELLQQAHRLALAGVDFFLLREPDLPARDLAHLARQVLAVFHDTGAPTCLLIHARADVAVAVGAHGVHLPSSPDELTPGQVRRLFDLCGLPAPVVSLSCHTLADLRRAQPLAPDLLLFGPVFEKRVRGELVQPGTGLDLLREACQLAAPTPVLALGGVTLGNLPACLEAGAAGPAGIRFFLER